MRYQQSKAAMTLCSSTALLPKLHSHVLQLQELSVQGAPAMDGLANLRVIQTTKSTSPVDNMRWLDEMRSEAPFTGDVSDL
jgi:hypothetical protein